MSESIIVNLRRSSDSLSSLSRKSAITSSLSDNRSRNKSISFSKILFAGVSLGVCDRSFIPVHRMNSKQYKAKWLPLILQVLPKQKPPYRKIRGHHLSRSLPSPAVPHDKYSGCSDRAQYGQPTLWNHLSLNIPRGFLRGREVPLVGVRG